MWVLTEWQVRRFMLTRTDVQRDLLQKFDELCKKANVKYVLHAHAAFLAYYNEPIDQLNSLEVLMCQGDAEKVSNLLDDDRYYFEDSKSNPKFDMYYMMFGLKNSLDLKNKDINFNTNRHIDNHCIRIIIHFIEQPRNKITSKILVNNRKILKFRHMKGDFNYRHYKSKRKFTNYLFKVINDDFYNEKMYNFKKKSISIDTWDDITKYPLIKITSKRPVESDMFESILPVKLDGISSFIIEDFETYAKSFYGRKWEEKRWPSVRGHTSPLVSWDEYSNDPEVQERIAEIQKRYDIIYAQYVKTAESRKVVRDMKKQIRQSKSVIYTREEMIEEKDNIMKLYQEGNMDELEIILEPLIKSLSIGINRGYTYSVDEDIDNIVDSYLRKTDESELADDIKKYRIEI